MRIAVTSVLQTSAGRMVFGRFQRLAESQVQLTAELVSPCWPSDDESASLRQRKLAAEVRASESLGDGDA